MGQSNNHIEVSAVPSPKSYPEKLKKGSQKQCNNNILIDADSSSDSKWSELALDYNKNGLFDNMFIRPQRRKSARKSKTKD